MPRAASRFGPGANLARRPPGRDIGLRREIGSHGGSAIYRLNRLTNELGVDRERTRLWAFGHAVAWGFEDGKVLPRHIETARWLLAD